MSITYWLIAVVAAVVLLALLGWQLWRQQPRDAGLLTESAAEVGEPLLRLPSPILDGIDSLKLRDASPKAANWWKRLG